MPDKKAKLAHDHGKYQKKGLDDQPQRVEAQHPGTNSKMLAAVGDHDVFDQDAVGKDDQTQR